MIGLAWDRWTISCRRSADWQTQTCNHGVAEDKARVFEPVRGRHREIGGVRWANESDQRCSAAVIGSQGGFPEPLAGSEAKVEGTKVPLL
ncbi:uncharacterized protein N7518_000941 [Penicillium psychrosexuale]|uniref:uncharacterized protein n=1 Tax=Penicillium psychrosexuale TaxID=1002107 RepID=UPI0025458348|nr:uncharacterized protein N7518_000941 [Penicillium psychrosexuale]KAJ5804638.1 hypothetical protein N7518_000941 [Penicillium psychrosexuale]